MRSVASAVRVCVCLDRANFESIDQKLHFGMYIYVLFYGISKSSSYVKVIGSRSRSQEQKTIYTSVAIRGLSAFD